MADLNGQMQVVVGQRPDYLTVLVGGNDLCTDTVAAMPSVADFGAQFTAAMNTLAAGSPDTRILVVSIPRVTQLWALYKRDFLGQVYLERCQDLPVPAGQPDLHAGQRRGASCPGRPAQHRLQRAARRDLRRLCAVPV